MRAATCLGFALVGLGLGAGARAAGPVQGDDLLALLEFLGDGEAAGDVWTEFFDSLPARPEAAPAPAAGDPGPATAGAMEEGEP